MPEQITPTEAPTARTVQAWANSTDPTDVVSDVKRDTMLKHAGRPGKVMAANYTIPLYFGRDQAAGRALMMRGVAGYSGDGFKDTTKAGDVVCVWNREWGEPYAPGQFPRVGYPIYPASAPQFRFVGLTDDEAIAVVDKTIEELRMQVHELRDANRVTIRNSANLVVAAQDAYRTMRQMIDNGEWYEPERVAGALDDAIKAAGGTS